MKTRIAIGFALIFALLLCPAYASSFTDMGQSDYERAVTELEALKVVKGYEDGTFRPDNELTRAEFCSLILNALGYDEIISQSETEFADVPSAHWASGCIKLAHDMGIINGYGDGNFGPEDNVTHAQALKMILNSMGYEQIANSKGGYPSGYILLGVERMSSRVKKGAEEAISRAEAAQLIYEALYVNIAEPVYSQDGGYRISEDKTLLTELMDKKGLEKREGIVTGDSRTRLANPNGTDKGWLEIDGTSYYIGSRSDYGMLGKRVTYYAQDSRGLENEPALYGVVPKKSANNEIVFSPKNLSSADKNEISYYPDDNSKRTEKAELNGNPIAVYNGKYTAFDADKLKVQNGQIRLLDNNGDMIYDIVFIDTYVTYMVDKVDTDKREIGLRVFSDRGESRFKGKTCIEYGYSDTEVVVEDIDGNSLSPSDLKPYDVIAVYAGDGESHVTVVRAEGTVEGTVESVTDEDIVIDGTEYELAVNNSNVPLIEAKPGEKGRFWLDVDNRITAKNVTSGSDYSNLVETIDKDVVCSYILAADAGQSTVDDEVRLKVLSILRNKTREEKIFKLKNTVKLDGEKMSGSAALEKLIEIGGGSVNMPIKYNLNSKEEIDSIETFSLAAAADYRKYSKSSNSFDGLYYLTDSSIVYYVDYKNKERVYDSKAVKLGDGMPYNMKVFDPVGTDYKAENRIFVIYINMSSSSSPETDITKPILVKAKEGFLDGEGQPRTRVVGFIGGEQVSLDLSEKAGGKAGEIVPGALMRITKNSLNELDNFKILAKLPMDKECRIGIGGENERVYGRVSSIESNSDYTSVILSMCYSKNGEDQSVSYEVANCPVYVVYTSRNDITVGTVNDIMTTQYGGDNASKVFVSVVNFKPAAIVVVI